jgi:hypothetical protein
MIGEKDITSRPPKTASSLSRYGANIVISGPKNSGYSEAIVITENIVVSGIVIARLYCMMNVFAMTTLLEGGMGYQRVFHR